MKVNVLITLLIIFVATTSLCVATSTNSDDAYPFASTKDALHFATLTKEIRCVVCQNQSIADSAAPLAYDLRHKIYEMMLQKKSDQEIEDYLVKRYGEFILLHPRLSAETALLWVLPFLFALFAIYRIFIRRPVLSQKTK